MYFLDDLILKFLIFDVLNVNWKAHEFSELIVNEELFWTMFCWGSSHFEEFK